MYLRMLNHSTDWAMMAEIPSMAAVVCTQMPRATPTAAACPCGRPFISEILAIRAKSGPGSITNMAAMGTKSSRLSSEIMVQSFIHRAEQVEEKECLAVAPVGRLTTGQSRKTLLFSSCLYNVQQMSSGIRRTCYRFAPMISPNSTQPTAREPGT